MGLDPISVGLLGVSGWKAVEQYGAGKEAEKAYKAQAAEMGRQNAYTERRATDEMRELDREGRTAQGQVRAGAGKSGLRAAGSVVTLTKAIAAKVARRKNLVAGEATETIRQRNFMADQYRRAGRSARRAGRTEAFGSLLTGGLAFAQRREGLGRKGTGLFYEKKTPVYRMH